MILLSRYIFSTTPCFLRHFSLNMRMTLTYVDSMMLSSGSVWQYIYGMYVYSIYVTLWEEKVQRLKIVVLPVSGKVERPTVAEFVN